MANASCPIRTRGFFFLCTIKQVVIDTDTGKRVRHIFITRALETGKIDVKDLARLVGNSPEMIYRHYAGIKRELIVPEF